MYRALYSLVLSRLPAESAHKLTLASLKALQSHAEGDILLQKWAPKSVDKRLSVSIFGHTLPHPVGIAAGLDKNAEIVKSLALMGASSIEVGTVTPVAQPGNEGTRVWRLPKQYALINALGFPSEGIEAVIPRLSAALKTDRSLLGINIGKNKGTSIEDAWRDYVSGVKRLGALGDYLTINISSPNTRDLRTLQREQHLDHLLTCIIDQRDLSCPGKPIALKLSFDLGRNGIEEACDIALSHKLDAIIMSNTTTDHTLADVPIDHYPGGLSGPPITTPSKKAVGIAFNHLKGRIPIIGVGGISSAQDVIGYIRAGAQSVQLYTALVYHGPALFSDICRGLSNEATVSEWSSFDEIRGIDAKKLSSEIDQRAHAR